MDTVKILADTQEIFRDVLDNDDVVLTESTTASDIEEWDSLSHIQLVFAMEKRFKIKFSSSEVTGLKNVGELVQAIKNKTGA